MPSRYIFQPFRLREQGAVALTSDADRHLHDKILAVLFTSPGERINRPRFGVGLNRAVFEGLSSLTLAAMEFAVTEGLRRDIGDECIIDAVDIDAVDGELMLTLTYRRRTDRQPRNLEIVL
jgi:Bacteriophage baseplate protein W